MRLPFRNTMALSFAHVWSGDDIRREELGRVDLVQLSVALLRG